MPEKRPKIDRRVHPSYQNASFPDGDDYLAPLNGTQRTTIELYYVIPPSNNVLYLVAFQWMFRICNRIDVNGSPSVV